MGWCEGKGRRGRGEVFPGGFEEYRKQQELEREESSIVKK